MLDREILKTDYAVSYGSVTLKSLQNDNVPELDLLVREAVQNSSDASLCEEGDSYSVGFFNGVFNPSRFNSYLSGLENDLNDMFPDESAPFLEIRDTKTCGLTGKIRKKDIKKEDHGNFFKLIYDTGKRQNITGAGGNWGFGKSVYYRVGIGIVVFYSRIKTENGFEDRMIITLVEDETKTDSAGNDITVLNRLEPLSAGKAWWGKRDEDDLLPITESELIQNVLDVFGLDPFRDGETGTSVIIPYINTKELLEGIIPVESEISEDVKEHFITVWASSISDYLRLCLQKWYAPKIHNRVLTNIPGCNKKWLKVTVDNKPIRKQDLLPFFRLTQELYTTALAKTYSYDYVTDDFRNIDTLPINIQSYFSDGQTVGYVSLIRILKSELNGDQNVLSPYDYIGRYDADGGLNEPIVMYARDPGMVIDYAITGPWVKNLTPPESPDEFIFAFFVPITDKRIKEDFSLPEYAGMELGEYLRQCEASDHMGWNDPVKMQIVQRFQRNTINQINKKVKASAVTNVDATASKLSNRLGRNLLPKIGYGKKKIGGGSGSGGGGTKITNISFSIISQTIKGNEVEMGYVLKLNHGKKTAKLSLMIASEGGWIDAESWYEDIGTEFPIMIEECFVDSVKTPISDYPYEIQKSCTIESNKVDTDELTVGIQSETDMDTITQISIESHVQNPEISGKILVRSYDRKYQFNIKVE